MLSPTLKLQQPGFSRPEGMNAVFFEVLILFLPVRTSGQILLPPGPSTPSRRWQENPVPNTGTVFTAPVCSKWDQNLFLLLPVHPSLQKHGAWRRGAGGRYPPKVKAPPWGRLSSMSLGSWAHWTWSLGAPRAKGCSGLTDQKQAGHGQVWGRSWSPPPRPRALVSLNGALRVTLSSGMQRLRLSESSVLE